MSASRCLTAAAALGAVACGCRPAPIPDQPSAPPTAVADVVSVEVAGAPGAYRFEVGVASPDRGCDQYADWWEVLDERGRLLYRRVLSHSHVDEQPFVRGGEPIPVESETVLWVRAHMHPTGYGGAALTGSVTAGFTAGELPATFADELAAHPPRPPECRW